MFQPKNLTPTFSRKYLADLLQIALDLLRKNYGRCFSWEKTQIYFFAPSLLKNLVDSLQTF